MLVTSKSLIGLDEEFNFLDNSCYLTEQESIFYPAMVPIVENSRLGLNLIKLEDLVDYSIQNNITDSGYAIGRVCEAAGIDIGTIGVYVNETSIIQDNDLEDDVRSFIENGVPTFIAPLPKSDIAYVLAEAVVSCMEDYNNADYLLEAYVLDDFDTLLNEEIVINNVSLSSRVKNAAGSVKDKASKVINKITDTVKSAKNASTTWISKKIASLGNLLSEYKDKAKSTASSGYNAICNKISSAIDFLKSKLPGGSK